MTDKIDVSDDILFYITLQRTSYLNVYFNLLPAFIKRKLVFIFSSSIKQKYNIDIANDYESIRRYLPETISNVLDIGCGIAGIDILIYKNHKNPVIHLLDKSVIDSKVFYGFEKEGSYYNSLALAKDFLIKNGIDEKMLVIKDLKDGEPNFPKDFFDLIVSTISWGFHYPILTYLEMVSFSLKPSGVLMLDVRKGTNGEKDLEKHFSIKAIKDYEKYIRYACKKK